MPKKTLALKHKILYFLNFLNEHHWALAIFVVLLGFLASTLLLLATGRNPIGMYSAMFQTMTGFDNRHGTFNVRYIGEWLTTSTPLVLCGLSVAFALRSGMFNIGAEGQYIMGLTFVQYFAFHFPQIFFIHALFLLVVGAIAGALWGGVVGYFKGKYQVSEVVSTIMLNYIAFFFTRWFTPAFVEGTNSYSTPEMPPSALISSNFWRTLTNQSSFNYGFFIMIGCVVLYGIILNKTSLGLRLRATGFNPRAARFAGVSTVKAAFVSMAISGAFAGLAGAIVTIGSFKFGRVLSAQDQYGFNGIAVALVAGSSTLGLFISGLFFGMLTASQGLMVTRQIPKEITAIISGLVVVFISLTLGFRLVINRLKVSLETTKLEPAKPEPTKSQPTQGDQ